MIRERKEGGEQKNYWHQTVALPLPHTSLTGRSCEPLSIVQ